MSIIYNGNYVKFESGLLICFGNIIPKISSQYNRAEFRFTFPVVFINTDYACISLNSFRDNTANCSSRNLTHAIIDTINVYYESSHPYSLPSCGALAIGYWK